MALQLVRVPRTSGPRRPAAGTCTRVRPVGRRRVGRCARAPSTTSRGASRRAHLLVQLVERVEAEVAAARGREPREDLPVRAADPGGGAERAARAGCGPPSRSRARRARGTTRPAGTRSRTAARSPSSSDWTTTVSTFCSARRASAGVGGVAERVDADQVQDVELALGRRAQDVGRVAAGGRSIITGPQTRSSSARSAGSSSRRPPGPKRGVHAGRAARRDRPRGAGSRARTGRRCASRGGERRRRRRPAALRRSRRRRPIPRSRSACERGVERRVRRRPPRAAAPRRPGRHEHVLGDVMQPGLGAGARTTIRAPRAAALRSRRCRIGTSCSASSPTTTIARRALELAIRHALGARSVAISAARRSTATAAAPAGGRGRSSEHRARELRQGVGVLVEQPAAR